MDKMKKYIPKSIAITCTVIGLYILFTEIGGLSRSVLDFIPGNTSLGMSIVSIVFLVLLALRFISSYGLYRLTSWGKYLAIGTLGFDFLFRFAGFLNIWTYYFRYPEKKAQHEEIFKNFQQAEENGEIVMTISMIPSYVIALISFVSVVLLLMNKTQRSGAQHLYGLRLSRKKPLL